MIKNIGNQIHILGGLQPDLGHPVRLPGPQGVRRADPLHQGVRQNCLGPHQPGRHRKFMTCSHCQELGQQASWLLIGCTRVNNQIRS